MDELELREQIAQEIYRAAHVGEPADEYEVYWVAGMEYAIKVVRRQT